MSKKCNTQITPIFLVLACFFVTSLLVSNIIAGKLITLLGITLPAAVILFPVTYIFGDILTEVYGFKRTLLVIWTGFGANLFMALVFMVTIALPYPEFWAGQPAYVAVLGFTPRVVTASLVGYFLGEFSNSIVLSCLKVKTQGRNLWLRTLASTVVGEGIDTVIFIAIAFGGVIFLETLARMMLAQYLWKVAYEVLLTPLTYLVVNWVKRKEGLDIYDTKVKYNPFSLQV
ncbi:MAG TPA: queuosine precursor transporter [Firmicutes bacterium]|nr:queuosine precursor transporter [Bacillota bacterium]